MKLLDPKREFGPAKINVGSVLFMLSTFQTHLDFDSQSKAVVEVLKDHEVYRQISQTKYHVPVKMNVIERVPECVTDRIQPSEGFTLAGRRAFLAYVANLLKLHGTFSHSQIGSLDSRIALMCPKTFSVFNPDPTVRRKENMYLVAGNIFDEKKSFQIRLVSDFPIDFSLIEAEIVSDND